MNWVKPSTYENPVYAYKRSPDQDAAGPVRHQAVVVGAGPVGLTLALDLAQHGVATVLLDEDRTVSMGSRAICFAKRTLEIADRLGAGDRLVEKGVTWNVGKVFFRENLVYEFDLLSESGHKMPAFINLQQYYFEEYLVDMVRLEPMIDLRWENEVVSVTNAKDGVSLKVSTPEGDYAMEADYLIACDGIHSPVREMLGFPYSGEAFEENFLIADITMKADFPTERWFWFDPPFNPGHSALLHKQPDGVWRIDLQLGRDIDRDKELDPERIRARLRHMLGEKVEFELEWTSIYQFKCMRMDRFVHGRVIFAGDSAHQVSPFGARGANGGMQDADNLAWKLAMVLSGDAPASLLETYDIERGGAADENIRHSSQATDFISPQSKISLILRNAALELAETTPFARKIVNSGRLSKPYRYLDSPLTTPDEEPWSGDVRPGYAALDAPLLWNGERRWFLNQIGCHFSLLYYADDSERSAGLYRSLEFDIPVHIIPVTSAPNALDIFVDEENLLAGRYDLKPGSWYLFRPDQHITARGRTFSPERIEAALLRATCRAKFSESTVNDDLLPEYPHDDQYNQLIKFHSGLSKAEGDALNARLILLLMGNTEEEEWRRLLETAKEGMGGPEL